MSFRTVVITKRCKLDTKMNYLEIRQADERKRIFLDEIDVLLIENPAISITGCLLSELINRKIKVIFCDAKHNPQSELIAYRGGHDSTRKIRKQIAWAEETKGLVWTSILKEKIVNQARLLKFLGKNKAAQMLLGYADELEYRDTTNREGHAARVYFNALFGMDFTRDDDSPDNAALNYGYTILLSMINREIVSMGYITQIGLFHDNVFNPFNLSSDLMEPFRILIDQFVYEKAFPRFDTNEKHEMLSLFQKELKIGGVKYIFGDALHRYVASVFNALEHEDVSLLMFFEEWNEL